MQNNNFVHSVNAAGPSKVQVGNQYTTNNYHGDNHQYDAKKHLAALRSTDPRHDKTRIEQTNGGLLKDSYIWIIENPDFLAWHNADHNGQILWIRGDPGKGKTMLLCGLIDELQPSTKLENPENHISLSFFFCQATNSGLNNAVAVLGGLIYLLAEQQPCLLSHLEHQQEYNGTHWNSRVALEDLFRRIMSNPALEKTYFIVDALDECLDDLSYLLALISSTFAHVKWIVSSRNGGEIAKLLGRTPAELSLSLELNESSVSHAVDYYIEHHIRQLEVLGRLDAEKAQEVQDYLSHNAEGTFLWVALTLQQIKGSEIWEIDSMLLQFPPGLDNLYRRMIDQVRRSPSKELYIKILAIASTVFRPIKLSELLAIEKLGVNQDTLSAIISACGSFLTTRKSTIFFVHQSAKDFLVTNSSTLLFWPGLAQHHYVLFKQSISILHKLDMDIYNLVYPGVSVEDAILNCPDPDPLEGLVYACVFWAEHLQKAYRLFTQNNSGEELVGIEPAHDFIAEKFLFWLEALSLCHNLSAAGKALQFLKGLPVKVHSESGHLALIEDAHRFLRLFRPAIENFPLQIYASGLLFSPHQSLIRKRFQQYTPDYFENTPQVDETWSSILDVFESDDDIRTVSFSPTGQLVVTTTLNPELIICDPHNSSVQKKTDYSNMRLLAASPDLKWLAAIPKRDPVEELPSGHDVLEIHDLSSSNSMRTIRLGNQAASNIDLSPDGRFLGVCYRGRAEIYDLATFGTSMRQVRYFELERVSLITHLCFSPDCTLAAAWTRNNSTLVAWVLDCRSGAQYKIPCPAGWSTISDIKFIPDSHLVMLCSHDKDLFAWDYIKERWAQSEPYGHPCRSMAFSHADSWVAFVTKQKLMLYDRHKWTLLKETGIPHLVDARIAVAPDDQMISLFDLERLCVASVSEILASESSTRDYECLHTSNDGRLLACISTTEVKVMDPTTGNILSTMMTPNIVPDSLSFSPKGHHLAFRDGSSMFTWDLEASISNQYPIPSALRGSLAISDAGTLLVGHDSSRVFVWDIMTGKLKRSFVSSDEGLKHAVEVAFAGSRLGVSWFPGFLDSGTGAATLVLYDIETGEQTSRIELPSPSGFMYAERLCISPNGKFAVFNCPYQEKLVISDLEASAHSAVVHIITGNCFFIDDLTISVEQGVFHINSLLAEVTEESTSRGDGQVRTNSRAVGNVPLFSPLMEMCGYEDSLGWITLDGKLLLWLPLQYRLGYTYNALVLVGRHNVTIESPSGLHCIRFKTHGLCSLRQAIKNLSI